MIVLAMPAHGKDRVSNLRVLLACSILQEAIEKNVTAPVLPMFRVATLLCQSELKD